MSSKDSHLYGATRPRKLAGGKEISSSTTLSFTSQLSSLINSSATTKPSTKPTSSRIRSGKDDIFSKHNRNTAKRAKRDLEDSASPALEQKHTTNGEALDRNVWERSKRKMEEKARLYAAMKRGDVEDEDEKYAVDFDRKWAETQAGGHESNDDDDDDDDDDDEEREAAAPVEYVDEFGRTRTGTAADAARVQRTLQSQPELSSDRFTARPSAPTNVIYGDTIQHRAFNPDALTATQMADLASKRDKSLTPPPDTHFDANAEIRTKGTGFFQFSSDVAERERQMTELVGERAETERRRAQAMGRVEERRKLVEERRRVLGEKRGKRKAEEFLERLGEELEGRGGAEKVGGDGVGGEAVTSFEGGESDISRVAGTEMMDKIQAAIEREKEDT